MSVYFGRNYGERALAEGICLKWFAQFKNGNFDYEDEERPGRQKKNLRMTD